MTDTTPQPPPHSSNQILGCDEPAHVEHLHHHAAQGNDDVYHNENGTCVACKVGAALYASETVAAGSWWKNLDSESRSKIWREWQQR